VVADGSDPSAVLYNPAGIARLDGFRAQVNLYTYFTSNSWQDPVSGETVHAETGVFPIPAEYVTYKPTDEVAIGVGGFSIFGLALEWPSGWAGQHIVEYASLRSYTVQPTIAIGPLEGLSFGAGFDLIYGSVEIRRRLPLASGTWGEAVVGGSSLGYGGNIGVLYEPRPWFRAGVAYRTPATVSLDPGDAGFEVPPAYDSQLRGQQVRTEITLPGMATFGIRVAPTDSFELEVDANLIQWSSYDSLVFQFDDPALDSTEVKAWHDAVEVRIGGQYNYDWLDVRLGFLFDQTPVPDETVDPTLPDNHRLIPSVGAGARLTDWLRTDLAYQFAYILPREVDASVNRFPGRYEAMAHTIVAGLELMIRPDHDEDEAPSDEAPVDGEEQSR
jgi:long-chain fatty acid transport protein